MEQLETIKHRNKQEKHRKNSELLTVPEIFRKIYSFLVRVKLASVLKSTLSGKLFQTLTIRSQKNLARTVAVEWFLYSLKLWPWVMGSRLIAWIHWQSIVWNV